MKFTFIDKLPNYFRGSLGQSFELAVVNVDTSVYIVSLPKGDNDVSGVSDEPYWNVNSPTGEVLSFLADVARSHGYKPSVCLTPYALPEFGMGGTASLNDFIDAANRVDVVTIDPYLLADTPGMEDKLFEFSRMVIDWCRANDKEVACILQGFAIPGLEERTIKLIDNLFFNLDFDKYWIGDAIDFWDIPDEWQLQLVGLPNTDLNQNYEY